MQKNIRKDRILILDFGSQYTQLIARRIRDIGAYCEIFQWNTLEQSIIDFNAKGIILSGSPESVNEENSPRAPKYVFEAGIPVLGICYGMQVMVVQLGGHVESSNNTREFGYAQVEIKIDSKLTYNIKDSLSLRGTSLLNVWMSHNDKIVSMPPNFFVVASTETCPFAIIANEKKNFYGLQFHPEVTHTLQGIKILKRFVLEICKCKLLWTPIKIIDDTIDYIRKQIGNDKVILGFSGGIDSSVAALLLHRAIGKNLICVFIDNGFLRLNEAKYIINTFRNYLKIKIIHIAEENRFLNALKGEKNPELKRKIIGKVFIEIFNELALNLKNIKWLAQGTIYSDIIESSIKSYNKVKIIKSHHNVGGLPKIINMNLIEPLKMLFKDEVRKIGLELGLPYDIIYRHPFPGPGLSVRIIGEVKKEYCDILRQADSIFIEELNKANLYNKISQAFTVFIPLKTVGIMGDNRRYGWIISLRAVESIDFMTANWVYLSYDLLNRISNRIINEVNNVSRVLYDISSKPPATIEWE